MRLSVPDVANHSIYVRFAHAKNAEPRCQAMHVTAGHVARLRRSAL